MDSDTLYQAYSLYEIIFLQITRIPTFGQTLFFGTLREPQSRELRIKLHPYPPPLHFYKIQKLILQGLQYKYPVQQVVSVKVSDQ